MEPARLLIVFTLVVLLNTSSSSQISVFFTGVEDLHYFNRSGQVQMVEDNFCAIINFENPVTSTEISGLINEFPAFEILSGGLGVTIFSNESLVSFFANINQFISDYNLGGLDVESIVPGYLIDGTPVFVNDEIVISIKDNIGLNGLTPKISRFGGRITDTLTNDMLIISIDSTEGQLELIQELHDLDYIEWGQPNFHVQIQSMAIDPLFEDQFQLHNVGQQIGNGLIQPDIDINALEAWNITKGNPNIKVAIMDDGLELHEDLSNVISGFNPKTAGNATPEYDDAYHGQACAGLIAADHNDIGMRGVAPDVSIAGINIFSNGITVAQIAEGFLWARDNDIDIISNSWGFLQADSLGQFINPVCNQDLHPVVTDAINEAAVNGRSGKGCIIVFSSGNSYSSSADEYCVTYPANLENVISVGAINPATAIRSTYSCYGTNLDVCAPSSSLLDFQIVTLDRMNELGNSQTNYKLDFGGTSAAAPLVSGVAALMLSINDTLSREQVVHIIEETCTDVGPQGFDVEHGYGMVNAYHAVLQALPGTEEYLFSSDCLGHALQDENFEESPIDPNAELLTSLTLRNGQLESYWYNMANTNYEFVTSSFDASPYSNLKLSFEFISIQFSGDDFIELQLSTNNGIDFHTVNKFSFSQDFENNKVFDYATTLEGEFGSESLVRIIASTQSGSSIFIDNIFIGNCTN